MIDSQINAALRGDDTAWPLITDQNCLDYLNWLELDSDGRGDLIYSAVSKFNATTIETRCEYIKSLSHNGRWVNNQFTCTSPVRTDSSDGSLFISQDGQLKDFADSNSYAKDIVGVTALFSIEPANMALGAIRVLRWFERRGKKPPMQWLYHDANGNEIIKIKRQNQPNGDKKFFPSVLIDGQWVNGLNQFKDCRPLYHLDKVVGNNKPIVFCEGEKSADAAQVLLGDDFVTTTTIGGAGNAHLSDYEPCSNRHCFLWRDNDDPGIKYESTLIDLLTTAGALSISRYLPDDWLPPKSDAWDYLINSWPVDMARFVLVDASNPTVPTKEQLKTIKSVIDFNSDISGGDDWQAPLPLFNEAPALDYPLGALPPNIRESVREINDYNGAPIGLIATCALSTLSIAVQPHINVARDSDSNSPVSLFTLVIAEPNERKSSVDAILNRAIRDYQRDSFNTAKAAAARHEALLDAYQTQFDAINSLIKDAVASGEPTGHLENQLIELELNKPIEPVAAKIFYDSVTPEALLDGLSRYPTGGIMSAEAGFIFGGQLLKRDNAMGTLALLNQLYSGECEGLANDRRTSKSYQLGNVRFTFAVQSQEAVLRSFLRSNGELSVGNGFLARFLIAYPKSTQGTRFYKEPVERINLPYFQNRIKQIMDMPIERSGNGGLVVRVVTMTPAAKALWVSAHDRMEAMLATPQGKPSGKAADNVARVAALFEFFTDPNCTTISASSMESAVAIVDYHNAEAMRLLSPTAGVVAQSDAARLDNWLLAQCREQGISEVRRHAALQYSIRKKDQLDAAIAELVELNRVKLVTRGKAKLLAINPALL